MNQEKENNDLMQNLEDAGCPETFIEEFMQQFHCGNMSGQQQLLKAHRRTLLDAIHQDQAKLDCLDFLIHRIKYTS